MRFAKSVVIVLSLATAATFASCKKEEAPATPPPSVLTGPEGAITKIWVAQNGEIEMNGAGADLDSVEKALNELVKQKGTVYYGREGAAGEPPQVAMKIIQMVTNRRLPVRLSTKKDFSDGVTQPGPPAKE